MPSDRTRRVAAATTATLPALAAATGVAAAQRPTGGAPWLFSGTSFVASLLVSLLVGVVVLAVAPEYVRTTARRVRRDPVASLGWGLLTVVVLVVASLLLVTMVVTVPVLVALGLVGNVVAAVALGQAVGGSLVGDDLLRALIVGVAIASLVALVPFLGGLAGLVLGLAGIGATVDRFFDGR